MYERVIITIKTRVGAEASKITPRVRYGSLPLCLSYGWIDKTYPYAINMKFVDDSVLADETARVVNAKIEAWREVMESKWFRISMRKIEYMECKFSGIQRVFLDIVTHWPSKIRSCQETSVWSTLAQLFARMEITKDVTHRLQVEWSSGKVLRECCVDS